jgi:hypothetical protein
MTITVDIGTELETRLLHEAAKHGMDPGQYIVDAVRSRLAHENLQSPHLDAQQSRLLEEINRGLSQAEWSRYDLLVSKRQAETLTSDELAELMSLTRYIEELNALRMERVGELARLRGTSLPELLDQLGITPPAVI